MADPFIAEIRVFGFNFAPRGWAMCNGQLLAISQNTALFSLLGTTYGGNGQTTFALPDLQGRAPLQEGQGQGLSSRSLGEVGGSETTTLILAQMPNHNHNAVGNNGDGLVPGPQGSVWAGPGADRNLVLYNSSSATTVQMNPAALTPVGGSQPHNNMMPYLTLNFCIALQGVYPPRP